MSRSRSITDLSLSLSEVHELGLIGDFLQFRQSCLARILQWQPDASDGHAGQSHIFFQRTGIGFQENGLDDGVDRGLNLQGLMELTLLRKLEDFKPDLRIYRRRR